MAKTNDQEMGAIKHESINIYTGADGKYDDLVKKGAIKEVGTYDVSTHRGKSLKLSNVLQSDGKTPATSFEFYPEQTQNLQTRLKRDSAPVEQEEVEDLEVMRKRYCGLACVKFVPLCIFLAIFFKFNDEEFEKTNTDCPQQIAFILTDIGIYLYYYCFAFANLFCLINKQYNGFRIICKPCVLLNKLSGLIDLALTIWGCTIMFGETYNKDMKWYEIGEGKMAYRGLFEAMLWVHLIPYMCCVCVICSLCVAFPVCFMGNPARQNQTTESLKNAPIIGGPMQQVLSKMPESYEGVKKEDLPSARTEKQNEVCTICFVDFEDHPNRLVCELQCSNAYIFHKDCLKRWVEKCDKCPLSKDKIPGA